uniref:Uncharacterized protein n=1 Tax=Spongospora subterranea TaxID=70186 RepID=A0A0H5R5H4_9EUKA|eukprot:CRZ09388.1 hypothetical protein [Spongospora subterranea]
MTRVLHRPSCLQVSPSLGQFLGGRRHAIRILQSGFSTAASRLLSSPGRAVACFASELVNQLHYEIKSNDNDVSITDYTFNGVHDGEKGVAVGNVNQFDGDSINHAVREVAFRSRDQGIMGCRDSLA